MHRPPRGRPPWWPENESWPPHRPWGYGPPPFVRRLGCLFAIVFLFGFLGLGSLAMLAVSALFQQTPPFAPALALLFAALLVIFFTSRSIRRIAGPVTDVIAATQRVGEGDFSARVPEPRRAPRELRGLVRAMNTMIERLETDEERRRTLLADVSHELRTPLTVIRGKVEAIRDGVYPADDEHLDAILDDIQFMARLVEDLRTLVLSEGGSLALHKEPTDIRLILEDTAGDVQPAAAQAVVTISAQTSGDIPLLDIDPVRIREVIGNLVDNAIRHTPPNGSITINAAVDGHVVRITVSDTGSGIDPDALPHIFERFVKGADSRGTGLGLAIVRSLIELHGGTISVESTVGVGSTFTIRLPLEDGSED